MGVVSLWREPWTNGSGSFMGPDTYRMGGGELRVGKYWVLSQSGRNAFEVSSHEKETLAEVFRHLMTLGLRQIPKNTQS